MAGKELDAAIRIAGEIDKSLKTAVKGIADQMDALEKAANNAQGSSADLEKSIRQQSRALKAAQSQYASYVLNGDEASQEAQDLADKIRSLSKDLNKNKTALSNAEKAAQQLADSYDDNGKKSKTFGERLKGLDDSAKQAKDGLDMMKSSVAGLASGAVLGTLIGKAKEAASAIFDLSESTRDFRSQMGSTKTTFEQAGLSSEMAEDAFVRLYGVIGEEDRALETATGISHMIKNQEDLDKWVTIATGTWAMYNDQLPIESLAEAANETAKTGKVTGTMADALNWNSKAAQMFSQYMSDDVVTAEDAFNKALEKCTTEQERQALVTDTLAALQGDSAAMYRLQNEGLISANEAAGEYLLTQSELGETMDPLSQAWTELKTTLAQALAPALETVAGALEKVIGWMQEHPAVVQAVVVALGILAAIITVVTIAVTIYTAVQMALNFALLPVIGIILAIVAAIAVVIAVVIAVKTHWEQIKQVAINVWNTILNVITTVVTAVWNVIVTIWSAIVSIVTTIWNAIVNAVSTAVNAVVSVVTSVWNGLVGIVSGIWNGILSVLHGIWNAITSAATAFANWVVSGISAVWNGLTNILTAPFRALSGIIDSVKSKVSGFIDKVKGIGSSIAGAIGLPGFAKGGFTDGISIAGEAGTEAVISFDPRYRADNLKYWAQAGRMLGADASDFMLSGGGGTTVNTVSIDNISFAPNITFNGDTDRESVVEAIREEYPEFLDMLEEWFAERGVTTYA